ncbi:hypothetical protein QN277_005240 [Acacia crassicarpa]|uniref:Uncharacterized protein n=1 Tax=Acacia crassicarpa TaxID=499986 RepID=A0AAE1IVY9_9FABA|nr:hypothetical protein QN277_005239 [Acacia crassicarpa]KAK4258838.1 hypothetical protein QN277_005240 [Acacia crassicarpa]
MAALQKTVASCETDSKVLNHRSGIRSVMNSGPNGRSGDHGGGSGVSVRLSGVRVFRLGGLVVGLRFLSSGGGHGNLAVGLGFGGRSVALGLGVHGDGLSFAVRHSKTKRD